MGGFCGGFCVYVRRKREEESCKSISLVLQQNGTSGLDLISPAVSDIRIDSDLLASETLKN